jgi:hypothetical protein
VSIGIATYFLTPVRSPDGPVDVVPEPLPNHAVVPPPQADSSPLYTTDSNTGHEHQRGESDVNTGHRDTPQLEPGTRKALAEMLNTSSDGLVEETRNGVTSVNLQRRFRTAPVATIDESGEVSITDYSHLPAEQ